MIRLIHGEADKNIFKMKIYKISNVRTHVLFVFFKSGFRFVSNKYTYKMKHLILSE